MIVVVHALLEEYKNELLTEITKFRIENGIQTKIVLIDIPETLEKPRVLALPKKEISSAELTNALLVEAHKIQSDIQEEIILQNLPEMLENPDKFILPENDISLEESRARKYHTKNMVRHFNRAQQYYRKHTYHNSRTKKR